MQRVIWRHIKMTRILKKYKKGELWEKVKTKKDFIRWTKLNQYKDYKQFVKKTGVTYLEIKGKWFQLIGGRIFTMTDDEMLWWD